jgi:DNA-binding response OmpR family regulator
MAQVLIVEDDVPIATLLADHLSRAGHEVRVVHEGPAALASHAEVPAELIVLDVMLPGLSGHDVCRELRSGSASQPIILMLTAKAAEEDSVLGFELGADDYVKKPFGVRELMARVEAMLRLVRRQRLPRADASAIVEHCALAIDPESRRVHVGGRAVELTPMEFDMLLYLARRPAIVLAREELLTEVWGYGHAGYVRTVDSHVTRVRKKLSAAGLRADVLRTVHGRGYAFEPTRATVDAPE